MSPSVQRAAIIGSIYMVGLYLGRQNSVMPAQAAAAACMVGLQPRILSDVSFRLSFTAMVGLVLLAPPIERGLRRILSEGEEEDGGWSSALTYAVATTIAATPATLPLVAFYFQQVSPMGLPATLLNLPVPAPTLGMGLVTAVLGLLNTGAAQVAGWDTWLLLSYLKEMVELFDPIPGSTLKVGWIGAPMVIVYYGAVIGFILGRSRLRVAVPVPPQSVRRILQPLNKIVRELQRGRLFLAAAVLSLLASAGV